MTQLASGTDTGASLAVVHVLPFKPVCHDPTGRRTGVDAAFIALRPELSAKLCEPYPALQAAARVTTSLLFRFPSLHVLLLH